ncbi:MAG TPA: recombinase A [Polyangiaceae bacterium]|jgi:recombination protein RecA
MSAAHDVEALLAQLGPRVHRAVDETERPLALGWPGLDSVLPDEGLPRGVVELVAPRALGGATSVALAAVRAGQARARAAWCAWVDPEGTLHAPGVAAAGVDLGRLLVVRSPRAELARTALKLAASGAFEVIVIDADAVDVASAGGVQRGVARGEVLARKLALAAEPAGSTVVLLTDSTVRRAAPWPVALRLELRRPDARTMSVRVAKDRRGRVGPACTVPFAPVAHLAG